MHHCRVSPAAAESSCQTFSAWPDRHPSKPACLASEPALGCSSPSLASGQVHWYQRATQCHAHPSDHVSWYENIMLSIKLEVHNILQRHQRRNETRSQATCIKNLVKFGHAVFELCKETHRQTETQTLKRTYSSQYFTTLWGRSNNKQKYVRITTILTMLLYSNQSTSINAKSSSLLLNILATLKIKHKHTHTCRRHLDERRMRSGRCSSTAG